MLLASPGILATSEINLNNGENIGIDDDLITKIRHAPVLGSIPRTNERGGDVGPRFRPVLRVWISVADSGLGLPYFFR